MTCYLNEQLQQSSRHCASLIYDIEYVICSPQGAYKYMYKSIYKIQKPE